MSKKAAEHHKKASEHLTCAVATTWKPPSITRPESTKAPRRGRLHDARCHVEEAAKTNVE
jgi:hypothetical protein